VPILPKHDYTILEVCPRIETPLADARGSVQSAVKEFDCNGPTAQRFVAQAFVPVFFLRRVRTDPEHRQECLCYNAPVLRSHRRSSALMKLR
jgi:hypothetical protein